MIQQKHIEERVPETAEGIIRVTARGKGYVSAEGIEEDIEVAPDDLNTALRGDFVRVTLLPRIKNGRERLFGEVLEIITRAKMEFVGTVREESGVWFVETQEPAMYADITIAPKLRKNAKPGQKVLAEITHWDDQKKNPVGEVLTVIGNAGENNTEMQAIVLEKGFDIHFPREVEREAADIKKQASALHAKELTTRRDMRDTATFTIDPKTAKDFDDALSVKKLDSGNFEIGIHIADVSFYVKPDSHLDREAARRSTSVYLVDRTIPMLPEVLSNDLCSLNPEEEKLAFSAILEMTPHGKVEKRWFGRTVIRSDKRFTYEEAHDVLAAKAGLFYDELAVLDEISHALRKKRRKEGAIAFERGGEVVFELDEKGTPITITPKEPLDTNKLIEDFMILANAEVATFVAERDENIQETFIYRVHALPDEEKLGEIVRLMRALGYEVPKKEVGFTAEDVNTLLEKVRGEIHEEMINIAVIQAMAKAIYSTDNIGHFGLSLRNYTHFTSPIRRYSDVAAHRLLERYLAGETIGKDELKTYESISRYASQIEILASQAERASIKYKQAEYMAARVGARLEGAISGVTEHGIFVEDKETKTEGFVHVRNLPGDYYTFDKKRFRLIGERTKKAYALGDAAVVRVVSADPETRRIDYELAG